jgi:hypothetical protein
MAGRLTKTALIRISTSKKWGRIWVRSPYPIVNGKAGSPKDSLFLGRYFKIKEEY